MPPSTTAIGRASKTAYEYDGWSIMNRFQHWASRVLRIPHLDETPEPEPNPYLDLEVAVVVRNSLEALAMSVWPAVHQAPQQAVIATEILMTNQLYLFAGLELHVMKGAGYELSQMVQEYLGEDTDPETVMGADWSTDTSSTPPGYISIKAEIYAFMVESFEGNWLAAANVVETLYRYYLTDSGGDEEAAAVKAIGLLSHLLVSMAHRFSLDLVPELVSLEDGADADE